MILKNLPVKSARRQRGIAMVEFAIVLPLLMLIMLGTAELGRAFYQYNTLNKAVRDGSRYLANTAINATTGVINLDLDNKRANTQKLVVFGNTAGTGNSLLPGLTVANITVTSPSAVHVTVAAQYAFRPLIASLPTFGLGNGDIPLNFTFRVSSTMRAL